MQAAIELHRFRHSSLSSSVLELLAPHYSITFADEFAPFAPAHVRRPNADRVGDFHVAYGMRCARVADIDDALFF